MRDGYSHLPEELAKAIDDYEAKKADGELQFTHDGEFAAMPGDKVGGWIQSFMASHLSVFDSMPRPNERTDYNRGTHPAPIPHRVRPDAVWDGKPEDWQGERAGIG